MTSEAFDKMVADVVAAYLSRNEVEIERIPEVIEKIRSSLLATSPTPSVSEGSVGHATTSSMGSVAASSETTTEREGQSTHVGNRPRETADPYASIGFDHITCLVCGKRQKATLKRHLRAAHNMHEHEYRQRFGIDEKTALTSKDYSEKRRTIAAKMHDNIRKK